LRLLPFDLRLPLIAALTLLATGCGVQFFAPEPGTELFDDIELTGSRTPGGDMTLVLSLTPLYPVAVEIGCYYEEADKELTDDEERIEFHLRAPKIGEMVLPAAPGRRPDEEPDDSDVQVLRFNFRAPEAGRYFVACLTPAAPENGISMTFRVRD
jgi:hypothetical protein